MTNFSIEGRDPALGEETFPCQLRVSYETAIETWTRRLLLGGAVATMGSCAAAAATPWTLVVTTLGLLVSLASLILMVVRPRGRFVPATATLRSEEGKGLILRTGVTSLAIDPSRIAAGWREDPYDVSITLTDGRELTLQSIDGDRATRIVDALGLGVHSRVLRMPLRGRAGGLMGRVGAIIGALSLVPGWLFLALILGMGLGDLGSRDGDRLAYSVFISAFAGLSAILWALVRLLKRRDVVVGADGLHLSESGAFVPWSKVSHAEECPSGVRVRRKDGGYVILPLDGDRRQVAFVQAQATLIQRIHAAMKIAADPRSPKLDVLDRNGQPPQVWKSALAALRAGDGNYRVLAVTDEELERVMADAQSPAERRVGAAFALGQRSKERAQTQVRVVVPACADEGLKIALERAADGEIDVGFVEKAARRA